ncbi:ATP-binding cassette domain-containing protein [Deinococcus metallilatus]|uniref:ABC-2 type transport system ATP-binding protein n=1 Tax=Deinococcus metallilatus TaxID=1211322 RepID=A0AAJ5F7T5_9DEIO|nr:ATP-binding cassette domain-containing protein [Deinococcus metallilatus]MBB5295964.1 ABC-2 type transport system ATP-binding protein [Deinococcus metallilatus]QBY08210.1 ATP-binding cassette domain-containing protein [Deinococcus metallilatus]RXJ11941.1 ATP-binding cassette domain-containing protein [Deinococcus metallilatus]TLK25827.1 ATP-binding cassette domain-containing protein [Deinococcus metallilatus]GMA14501.1 ABC transporter ATP-binding protein [Deinococcus metallilatus]
MIEVEHLHKSFQTRSGGLLRGQRRTVEAVRDVSFRIEAGEVVGYLGPNGAGKSTTIKMLTGLLVPTAGRVEVGGLVPWRDRRRHVSRLGAVFGQRTTLWWDLPVRDSLDLLRDVYRVPPGRFRENLKAFTDLLDLGPFLGTPARSLSLGQRMRADLAAALLHDPELLFLDEPTVGLDVVAKERIRAFVAHVNRERGATVLLTTHDLTDVERLTRRVMIIDHGALLYDGNLPELQARFGSARELVVDFEAPPADPRVPGLVLLSAEGPRVTYAFTGAAARPITLVTARAPVRDVTVREPDIEATIRRIYEGGLLGAGAVG